MNFSITVIVPVYKTEKYIRECVDSILSQDAENIEILLMDDASPDSCPQICDEYAEKYENVFAVHRENGGIAAVRNDGVARARGKYITFVDSDDKLPDSRALGELYRCAEENGADITQGNFRQFNEESVLSEKKLEFENGIDPLSEYFRFWGFYGRGHLSYTWAKLYRREFLTGNSIENQNFRYTQDKLFNFICYTYLPKYAFVNSAVYLYRINTQSITFKYKENYAEGWMQIIEAFREFTQQKKFPHDIFDLIAFHVLFGAVFVGKQEMPVRKNIKAALDKYAEIPIAKEAMAAMAQKKYLGGVTSRTLKFAFCHFSRLLSKKRTGILSLEIYILSKLGKI